MNDKIEYERVKRNEKLEKVINEYANVRINAVLDRIGRYVYAPRGRFNDNLLEGMASCIREEIEDIRKELKEGK